MDSKRKQERAVDTNNTGLKHEITHSEYENRVKKAYELESLGDKPWAEMRKVINTCQQIVNEFTEGVEKPYIIAGRILTKRMQGKAGFVTIQDRTGRLQLYIREDGIGAESFKKFIDFIDMGDIIWAEGHSFKTKTGEISLRVSVWQLLTKNLHPLPEKFHGIHDIETKYRQRYLDLMTSQETRERFIKRTAIIKEIRSYLDKNDFLEVETPMLHPIPGGAAARPFITHHNALDTDFYLRIAPELY